MIGLRAPPEPLLFKLLQLRLEARPLLQQRGAAVAIAGVIGFVGLVVPHLLRLSAGPVHDRLLVGCAFSGAALLLMSDIVARTVASPAEVPIGVVTAIIGAPYFLYLVHRNRAALGG